MATTFLYGVSSVTFSRDPAMGNISTIRRWRSPVSISGGGSRYVYDKSIVHDVLTLTWMPIDPTDLTNFLTFLDAVDGTSNAFQLITDTRFRGTIEWDASVGWDTGVKWAGEHSKTWSVYYLGPDKPIWTPVEYMKREFTIELLISSP